MRRAASCKPLWAWKGVAASADAPRTATILKVCGALAAAVGGGGTLQRYHLKQMARKREKAAYELARDRAEAEAQVTNKPSPIHRPSVRRTLTVRGGGSSALATRRAAPSSQGACLST